MGGSIWRAWIVAAWLVLAGVFAVPRAAHAQEREARVLHILEATQEEAQRSKSFIILFAKGNQQRYLEEFQSRARSASKDLGSARNGGDLGFAKPSAFVPEFAAAMLTAPIGDVVGPVKTQFGWHLLMVTEWRSPTPVRGNAPEAAEVAPPSDPLVDVANRHRVDWRFSGGDVGKFIVLRHRIIKDRGAGLKSVWVMFAYAQPQTYLGKSYQSVKQLWWFRCSDQTSFTTELVQYGGMDGTGDVVSSWSQPFDAKHLTDVVPGSVGEGVLTEVCSKK